MKQQVGTIRPRKRKVQISPNSKFADIEVIYKAQIEAGEKTDRMTESSGSGLPSEPEYCIIVASKKVENSG